MDWPGFDEPQPVIINANGNRPGHIRPRLASSHQMPRNARSYYTAEGQLLVPAEGSRPPRSASVSGRPAQINIYNDNIYEHEDEGHHSRSPHRHFDDYSRSRSHSRVRIRDPSPRYDYELEMTDKMRRLEMLERKDEEVKARRLAELEAIRRKEEDRRRRHEAEVEEIARREEEEKRRKHIEEEIRMDQMEKEAKKEKQKKHDDEVAKRAVEDYEAAKIAKKVKEKKEKEEKDKIEREGLRRMLLANGYREEDIDRIIDRAEHPHTPEPWGHHTPAIMPPPLHHEPIHVVPEPSTALALPRPTYIKVHRKYLDIETLETYKLPWDYDERDTDYIVIKRWIPEHEQDILFEHTRKLRETKRITYTTTELKKERDQLLLVRKKEPVRKKSPARRSWILT